MSNFFILGVTLTVLFLSNCALQEGIDDDDALSDGVNDLEPCNKLLDQIPPVFREIIDQGIEEDERLTPIEFRMHHHSLPPITLAELFEVLTFDARFVEFKDGPDCRALYDRADGTRIVVHYKYNACTSRDISLIDKIRTVETHEHSERTTLGKASTEQHSIMSTPTLKVFRKYETTNVGLEKTSGYGVFSKIELANNTDGTSRVLDEELFLADTKTTYVFLTAQLLAFTDIFHKNLYTSPMHYFGYYRGDYDFESKQFERHSFKYSCISRR